MTRYCYKKQTFWWPSSYISPKSPTDTFSSMIISLLWPRLFSIGRKVSLQKVSNLIIDKVFERLRSMSTLQCQIWKWNQNFIFSLPHFMPLISFYAPWKHQTTFCFLTFLGGIKRVHDRKGLILSKFSFFKQFCQFSWSNICRSNLIDMEEKVGIIHYIHKISRKTKISYPLICTRVYIWRT